MSADRRSFLASLIGVVAGWRVVAAEPGEPRPSPGYDVTAYAAGNGMLVVNDYDPPFLAGDVVVTTYTNRPGEAAAGPEYTEIVCGTVTGPGDNFTRAVATLCDVGNAGSNRVRLGLGLPGGGRLWLDLTGCVNYAVGFSARAGDMVVAQDFCVKGVGLPGPAPDGGAVSWLASARFELGKE